MGSCAAPTFQVYVGTNRSDACNGITGRVVYTSGNDPSLAFAAVNGSYLYRSPSGALLTGWTWIADGFGGTVYTMNSTTGIVNNDPDPC